MGDGAGGVDDAVSFETAVAQYVPGLHMSDTVLDSRAYSLMDRVEVVLRLALNVSPIPALWSCRTFLGIRSW